MWTWIVTCVLAAAPTRVAASDACSLDAPGACSPVELEAVMSEYGDYLFGLHDENAIRDAIVRRVGMPRLLRFLREGNDSSRRAAAVEVLRGVDDAKVAEAFAARLADGVDSSTYRMTLYLARRGDPRALRQLLANYLRWEVSSLEMSAGVEVFGQHRFYAATPRLIESLDAASLNLAGGALETLGVLYPGAAPTDMESPSVARRYYTRRWRERSTR